MSFSMSSMLAKKKAGGFMTSIKDELRGGSKENSDKQKELKESRKRRDAEFSQQKKDRIARKSNLERKRSAAEEARQKTDDTNLRMQIFYRCTCMIFVVAVIGALIAGVVLTAKSDSTRGGSTAGAKGYAAGMPARVVVAPSVNFLLGNVETVCTKDKIQDSTAGYDACRSLCEKARCCFIPKWIGSSCRRSEAEQCRKMRKACNNLEKVDVPTKDDDEEGSQRQRKVVATGGPAAWIDLNNAGEDERDTARQRLHLKM